MIDIETIDKIEKLINFKKINNSKIKRVLITGCGGFIGGYLTKTLLNKKINLKIYGIDIIKPMLTKNNKKNKNFIFIKKDLTKIKKINIKEKIDLIIHLAGIPSPVYYKKYPLNTYFLNSDLSKLFLDFSKKNNCKFIYFSSSEIYGNPDKYNIPTKETYEGRVSSISDRSCYDESKRSGETYCYIYKNLYDMDIKIIRPFNFYGNGMRHNDKRIIPQFFHDAINNKFIKVFSDGKQTRTYCSIIDAIPVIINIAFFGKDFVYNIGNSNQEISAFNVAKIDKKTIGNNNIKILKTPYPKNYPSNEPQRRCPDTNKIKKEFRFTPTVNLQNGLKLFYKFLNKE